MLCPLERREGSGHAGWRACLRSPGGQPKRVPAPPHLLGKPRPPRGPVSEAAAPTTPAQKARGNNQCGRGCPPGAVGRATAWTHVSTFRLAAPSAASPSLCGHQCGVTVPLWAPDERLAAPAPGHRQASYEGYDSHPGLLRGSQRGHGERALPTADTDGAGGLVTGGLHSGLCGGGGGGRPTGTDHRGGLRRGQSAPGPSGPAFPGGSSARVSPVWGLPTGQGGPESPLFCVTSPSFIHAAPE